MFFEGKKIRASNRADLRAAPSCDLIRPRRPSSQGGLRKGYVTHRSSSREKRFLVRQKSHMLVNPLRPAAMARARGASSDSEPQEPGRVAEDPSRTCAGHHAAAAGGGAHRIRGGGDRRRPVRGDRGSRGLAFCLFDSLLFFLFLFPSPSPCCWASHFRNPFRRPVASLGRHVILAARGCAAATVVEGWRQDGLGSLYLRPTGLCSATYRDGVDSNSNALICYQVSRLWPSLSLSTLAKIIYII